MPVVRAAVGDVTAEPVEKKSGAECFGTAHTAIRGGYFLVAFGAFMIFPKCSLKAWAAK